MWSLLKDLSEDYVAFFLKGLLNLLLTNKSWKPLNHPVQLKKKKRIHAEVTTL